MPEVNEYIKTIIGDISKQSKTNKSTSTAIDATFDIERILETIDTVNNKNYNIRFLLKNTPENVFYNLIVNFLPDGQKHAFVQKQTCDIESYSLFKNNAYNMNLFKGKIEFFYYTSFFKKTGQEVTAKITDNDDCLPKFYPNGDPVPTLSSFISPGGSQTSSGGAQTGSSSSGNFSWPATGGYGLSVNVSGTAVSSNASGSGTGFFTAIGNAASTVGNAVGQAVIWIINILKPKPCACPSQKMVANPCPDIIPVGFTAFISEPEYVAMLRARLPLTLQQWQWLHGKDDVTDFIQKYINSNPTNINQSKEVALWAIDYMMNNPKPVFTTFTIDYIQNNPTVTWKQFQNWFMGSPEGNDGGEIYNPTDYIGINVSKQNLPGRNTFYDAFPKVGTSGMPSRQVYELVGGHMWTAHNKGDDKYQNACAIRVSRALNYSGKPIPVFINNKLEQKTEKGKDGLNYILDASSLLAYMLKAFPDTPPVHLKNKTPDEYQKALNGKWGIYIMVPKSGFGASGHADFYSQSGCLSRCYFSDAAEIYFWELK